MNDLKKQRLKTTFKYTWSLYLISSILVVFALFFLFKITHRTPMYQTLTVFISGEYIDDEKLKNDFLNNYGNNQLKEISTIYANPSSDNNYYRKLSVIGYNSSDVLIIPNSILANLNASAFALDIDENLYQSYFQNLTEYKQNDITYGIEIDKEKIGQYFVLPDEHCYMLLAGSSKNIGIRSSEGIKEHDNALRVVRDWGKQC